MMVPNSSHGYSIIYLKYTSKEYWYLLKPLQYPQTAVQTGRTWPHNAAAAMID